MYYILIKNIKKKKQKPIIKVSREIMRNIVKNYFKPKGNSTEVKIDSVEKHIKYTDCNYMTLDISKLNPLEASKIAVLCSTNHYLKYPQGIVDCIVKTTKMQEIIKPLTLGNMKFMTMQNKN